MRHDSHYVEEFAKSQRSVGRTIPIHLIAPNPEQPRVEIGDLTELSGSIKDKGVLEPILVKPNHQAGTWMIIAGERRWRAANLAGLTEMPCIELDISEKDIAEIALIENLQRKDLTVWEEVDGYAYLVEKFDYTHEDIAKKIGKSRTTVTESLTVAGLPEDVRAKCRLLDISSKSALLEVARQFDEQAMRDFLDNYKSKKSVPRKNKNPAASGEAEPNGTQFSSDDINTGSRNSRERNVYKFNSEANSFNLEITFSKNKASERNIVLAALKEVYNSVKNEDGQ